MATLQKITNAGFAELADRGRQKALKVAERFGLSASASIPSDEAILDELGFGSSASLLDHLRNRPSGVWYPSFDNVEATKDELRRRFPDEEGSIISAADILCAGYFNILGYERLDFDGPVPNWHLDPVTGNSMPKIHWSLIDEIDGSICDKKIIWELNRHQYFSVLGRAYALKGNEQYARVFVKHLSNWFAENPPKIGVNWMSSLEIAFRSMSWIWALNFFRHSPVLTPEFALTWMKFIGLNGKHLANYLSRYFSPNTHLTGEALGLFMIGTSFPEFREARKWRDLGYSVLIEALEFQIAADGGYCEQSSHYHRYTADFYLNLIVLLEAEATLIEPQLRQKLVAMLAFLANTVQPNGETSLYGDDDGGRLHFLDRTALCDFRPTIALGATLLDDGELKFTARNAGPELLWLLGRPGVERFDALQSKEPPERCRLYRDSGILTVRDSWHPDASHLLVHCGKHGFMNGGHAHADALSFVYVCRGTPVFIDSGTYNYTTHRLERQRLRSAASHNCLTVNGESSSAPDGPFSWKNKTDAEIIEWHHEDGHTGLRGRHKGFERLGVIYERTFDLAEGGSIHIGDTIESLAEVRCDIHFILAPGLVAKIDDGTVRIGTSKEPLVVMSVRIESDDEQMDGAWRMEPWNVSPGYGALTKTSKIVFAVKVKGKLRIKTHIEVE